MKKLNTTLPTILLLSFATHAEPDINKSDITVGLGTKYAPKYMGSDKYNSTIAPYFDWTNGIWFANSAKGVGLTYSFDNGLYLGQALGYAWGRKDDDSAWFESGSSHLKGMGKIKTTASSTTTLGWWMTPWIGFEGNVIAPLTDSQGALYNIGLNVILFHSDSDTLLVSNIRNYGDARYNNTWFGVTDKQSANTGFKQFTPDGGSSSVDYAINWQHTFDQNWSAYADLRYTTLANHVRYSPVVEKDDYMTFDVGAFYKF